MFRAVSLFSEPPLKVAPLPPAVARYQSSFFLPLHLRDADPKAPFPWPVWFWLWDGSGIGLRPQIQLSWAVEFGAGRGQARQGFQLMEK